MYKWGNLVISWEVFGSILPVVMLFYAFPHYEEIHVYLVAYIHIGLCNFQNFNLRWNSDMEMYDSHKRVSVYRVMNLNLSGLIATKLT